MTILRRAIVGAAGVAGGIVLLAGPAFAHECLNASKQANNPGAGAQIVLGPGGEIVHATNGIMNRFEKGLIGPEGEGFHGIIGFDEDGDGEADGSTYIVGRESKIPEQAQEGGQPCKGITDFGTYFTQCVGG